MYVYERRWWGDKCYRANVAASLSFNARSLSLFTCSTCAKAPPPSLLAAALAFT